MLETYKTMKRVIDNRVILENSSGDKKERGGEGMGERSEES
jgi:hypothetical protein